MNEDEAPRVRRMYQLYLDHQALTVTVQAVAVLGWTNKAWVNKPGKSDRGGLSRMARTPNAAAPGLPMQG